MHDDADALDVQLVGELRDQQPHTGDDGREAEHEAGEQPDFHAVAGADAALVASSVQHLVRDCVDHDQGDGAEHSADVVAEVGCCARLSGRCDPDDDPPSAEELKQKQRRENSMNHPSEVIAETEIFTSKDERTAERRFLREMMFTSNHMHI